MGGSPPPNAGSEATSRLRQVSTFQDDDAVYFVLLDLVVVAVDRANDQAVETPTHCGDQFLDGKQ